jgi:hypothetical protein
VGFDQMTNIIKLVDGLDHLLKKYKKAQMNILVALKKNIKKYEESVLDKLNKNGLDI